MSKNTKRKCVLTAKLKENYPFLETTTSESDVYCKTCKVTFSIASGGDADIKRHVRVGRHQTALNAASSSQKIESFFSPTSTFDAKNAAMEGTWAFHTINANHSFKSSDCATKIFRTCFQLQKFSCSQTKCRAIIVNVFAPQVQRMLEEDLKRRRYVTVYTDASNHGNIKLFPVLVRYFNPTVGVCVKVLEITSEDGETSTIINELISKVATKFDLKKKIVALCGDNAAVNFGGETRGGENNVLFRMKVWLPHLIGIGCVAHIVHNALKYACDVAPFDVECIIVKIYSYFYLQTTHVTALKGFCEAAGVDFKKLLGYSKTRFLALGPAIKRVLELYDVLKELFTGLNKGEKLLKEFFKAPMSKFWLRFIQEQAELFAEYVLKIEGDEVAAIEIVRYVNELQINLKMRMEDDFLSPETAEEKRSLVDRRFDAEILTAKCKEFFDDACEYIELWTSPIMELHCYSWAALRKIPVWKDVEYAMQTLDTKMLYDAKENAVKLHRQFGYIKSYCSLSKIKHWNDENVSIPNRWVEIFRHLESENCDFDEIAGIIEYILCMPGSTASVERVFSGMNKTWTADKTKLKVETLKAILTVKVNLKMTCSEVFTWLKSQPEMLGGIQSKEKYIMRTDNVTVTLDDDSDVEDILIDSDLI